MVSGGELSRIMLAIKTLLADKDCTETLIFDESDTGISGRTAQKVAKMALIGEKHQVLCIIIYLRLQRRQPVIILLKNR